MLSLGLSVPAIATRRGAGIFNPSTLFASSEQGGLWQAKSLSGASGTAVSSLNDQTANARHFTQGTAAAQPVIQADANGRKVVRFDGVDDKLIVPTSAGLFNFLHNGAGCEVWMVARVGTVTDPNAAYVMLSSNDLTVGNNGASLYFDDRTASSFNNAMALQITGNGASLANPVSNNTLTPNTVAAFGYRLRTADTPDYTMVNKTTAAASGDLSAAAATANATDLVVGGRGSASLNCPMDLYELLIINRVLTDTERGNLLSYFGKEYGV